jgi:hypothetical protein
MMKQHVVRSALAGILAAACNAALASNPLKFDLAPGGPTLILEGRWESPTGKGSALVPKANSVRIECDRNSGRCTEFLAQLVTKVDDPDFRRPAIFTFVAPYAIIEWNDTRITARAETRAYDFELHISLVDRSAERSAHETGARGAAEANPANAAQWILK